MTGWQAFRERLLAALDQANPQQGDATFDRYWRLAPDHWIHACPACRSSLPNYLAIRFAGETAAADFCCSAGCTPQQLAHALDLPVVTHLTQDKKVAILRTRRDRQLAAHGIGDYTTPSAL